MKKLILIFLIFITNAHAGVGGIDGGSVHFQKDSTWVNMVYSKTLCYKDKAYFAKSRKCKKWERHSDDRNCVKYANTIITQPEFSTRQRCKTRDDDGCKLWETITYHQKRDRVVRFKDEDGHILRTEKLRVKACK